MQTCSGIWKTQGVGRDKERAEDLLLELLICQANPWQEDLHRVLGKQCG